MKKDFIKKFILLLGIFLFAISGYYVCPIKYVFDIYCPGCGTTRMILAMFKLDFYQAFRYNPLMFILLLVAIIYMIISLLIKKKIEKPNGFIVYSLLVILIMYTVLRNIPVFSYLIPTEI